VQRQRQRLGGPGNRMLLVEDEALVAMAMKDALVAFGFDVLGAYSTAAEALAAAMQNEIDAAILDINLGGELVYPLADYLVGREVPIIFATGYGAETIDPRFAKVPVLRKPIDRELLQNAFVLRVDHLDPAAARRAELQGRRASAGRPRVQ
jgi:DNA-binding response OmpR family regulator